MGTTKVKTVGTTRIKDGLWIISRINACTPLYIPDIFEPLWYPCCLQCWRLMPFHWRTIHNRLAISFPSSSHNLHSKKHSFIAHTLSSAFCAHTLRQRWFALCVIHLVFHQQSHLIKCILILLNNSILNLFATSIKDLILRGPWKVVCLHTTFCMLMLFHVSKVHF